MNKILNILLIIILLSSFAIADSGVYDNVNHHEYNIYNVTNATATTFFGALTGTASIATLWASVTSYNSTQFTDISNILNIDMSWLTGIIEGLDNDTKYTAGDYLYLDGTEFNVNGTDLNATIDARDTDTTYTAGTGLILTSTVFSRNKSFFDTNYYNQTLADTTFITKANEGNLNVNHSDTSGNAGTVTNGVYTTDFPLNQDTTGTAAIATSWDGETSQADLNVNSSVYWDSLNSPTDITSLGTIGSATSITSTIFLGPLTGTASIATLWASVTSFASDYFYDNSNVLTLNETKLNKTINALENNTEYTAGNYLYLDGTEFNVNETDLNATIDARENNTEYSAGSYLYLSGTQFNVNETDLNATIDNRDTDTTYSSGVGLILTSTTFSRNQTFFDKNYYNQTLADSTFIEDSSEGDLNVNSSVYWDSETSQANLNVNSSDYWDSYGDETDLTINWSQITNEVLRAVDDVYLYLSGNIITFNDTKNNATINAIATVYNDSMKVYVDNQDVIYNDSMKVYVDNQDVIYNDSMKTYTDNTFITQANEGNLNVNHSVTSGTADTATTWDGETSQSDLNVNNSDTVDGVTMGTITNTKWCVADGTTEIDCNVEPVSDTTYDSDETYINEAANQFDFNATYANANLKPANATNADTLEGIDFGTLSDTKWCVYDLAGTEIDCDVEPVSDTTYTAGNKLYLSSTEFNVNDTEINSSIEAYGYSTTTGTVTSVAGSGVITSTGGTDPIIGATVLKDLITTAPLTGGVDNIFLGVDSDLTIAMPVATTSADGYLSQTDWDTFNNKADTDTTYTGGDGITITGTEINVTSGTYRLDSWNNFTGIPTATPTDGDTTHLSTSDQIRDYVIGLGYSTTTGTVTSVATDDTYLTGGDITSTGTITFNSTLAGTDLAVNSSDYWDGLGSPSDINAGDITSDGTYILSVNEGNLNVNYSTTSGTATTWDGETSQGNLNVNSSTTSGTATTWDGETSQANLNVNSSTYTSFWASVSSFVSSWFYDNSNVLSFNESKLNNTIDARSDFDSRWSVDGTWIYNNSGDLSWNTTSGDARYYTQTAANSQFIEDSSEGDLNVNSSDYWDSLGSPSDINAGDITDDGTYYDTTSNMNVTNYNITASRFISDIVTGTSPFSVASTTLVTNLNANMVEGIDLGTLTDGKACTYDLAGTEIDCDTTLTLGTVTSVTGSSPITSSEGTTPAIGLTACSNAEGYVYNTTSSAWECRALGSGSGSVTSIATDDVYLTGGPITGSGTITFNETLMNDTIDARSTSTEYTAGKYLYLDGTQFNVNDTMINDSIESYDYATVTSLNTKINITSEGDLNVNSSTYWDSETSQGDLNVNYSTTSGTATTWDSETSQSNLNVNSSNYWDGLNTPSDINAGDITDDGTYRLDSWNNLTGIPHATPADGDITHFSLSDEIYDWVIGLSYSTTVGTVTSVTGSTPITSTEGTTPEIGITMEGDLVTTAPLTGAANDIFPGTGTKATIAATILKDLVTTAPLTGGTNDVFLGTDSDLTVAITVLKDIVAGIGMTGGEDNVLPGADADVTLNVNETWVNDTIESYGYSTTTGTVTSVATDDTYLTGGTITTTGTITLNETLLNTTIDARSSGDLWSDPVDSDIIPDTDATYTFGNTTNGFTTVFVDKIEHPGDSNNFIDFNSADNIRFTTGGSIRLVLNNQGMYVGGSGAGVTTIYDNDTLGEDSATALATQQSIKKYVDDNAGTGTVTSVATDDTYLTGGAITTTGTITFSTALAGTDLAVNSSDNWDGLDSPTDITSLGTIGSATSITSTAFVGPLTGTADVATTWASVTSFIAKWFYDNGNVLTFNETALNDSIESYGYSTTVGTVTGVSGTSPIVSSGGATPAISATILKDLVTTAPITGAADNIFLGTDSDITIAMPVASTSADGYLSSTNWNTFNNKASSDTTYSAGNGISESSEVFSVAGNTALTQDADGLSVTAGGIGDTQIADAYINQALTTTSNPTFNNITVTTCIIFASGGKFCSGT